MALANNELDMFTVLGLIKADESREDNKNSDNNINSNNKDTRRLAAAKTQFLKITLIESSLMNPKKDNENDKYKIVLPYHHEKSIQDSLSARITNNWDGSNNGIVGTQIAKSVQNLTTGLDWAGKESKLLNFVQNNVMFKYDGGSTKKTLQIPFIVPLGLATGEALKNGAAKNMRFIFNKLQGLLYPNDSVAYMPPLMELTIGGLYQSFYGFITNVTINPTNPDMFQDPYSGQYFHLVYDGTITFENLFTYYHGEEADTNWNIDNANVEVLFGKDSLPHNSSLLSANFNGVDYYGSERTAKAIANVLYNNSSIANRINTIDPRIAHEATTPPIVLSVPQVFASDSIVSNLMAQIRTKDTNSSNAKIINKLNDNLQTIFNNYKTELLRDNSHADSILRKYIQQVRSILTTGYNKLS